MIEFDPAGLSYFILNCCFAFFKHVVSLTVIFSGFLFLSFAYLFYFQYISNKISFAALTSIYIFNTFPFVSLRLHLFVLTLVGNRTAGSKIVYIREDSCLL